MTGRVGDVVFFYRMILNEVHVPKWKPLRSGRPVNTVSMSYVYPLDAAMNIIKVHESASARTRTRTRTTTSRAWIMMDFGGGRLLFCFDGINWIIGWETLKFFWWYLWELAEHYRIFPANYWRPADGNGHSFTVPFVQSRKSCDCGGKAVFHFKMLTCTSTCEITPTSLPTTDNSFIFITEIVLCFMPSGFSQF